MPKKRLNCTIPSSLSLHSRIQERALELTPRVLDLHPWMDWKANRLVPRLDSMLFLWIGVCPTTTRVWFCLAITFEAVVVVYNPWARRLRVRPTNCPIYIRANTPTRPDSFPEYLWVNPAAPDPSCGVGHCTDLGTTVFRQWRGIPESRPTDIPQWPDATSRYPPRPSRPIPNIQAIRHLQ